MTVFNAYSRSAFPGACGQWEYELDNLGKLQVVFCTDAVVSGCLKEKVGRRLAWKNYKCRMMMMS